MLRFKCRFFQKYTSTSQIRNTQFQRQYFFQEGCLFKIMDVYLCCSGTFHLLMTLTYCMRRLLLLCSLIDTSGLRLKRRMLLPTMQEFTVFVSMHKRFGSKRSLSSLKSPSDRADAENTLHTCLIALTAHGDSNYRLQFYVKQFL